MISRVRSGLVTSANPTAKNAKWTAKDAKKTLRAAQNGIADGFSLRPLRLYFAAFAVKGLRSVTKLTAYPTANVTTVPIATYQVQGTFVNSHK